MAETKTTSRRPAETEGPKEGPAERDQHVCQVAFCPIGLALSAVNRASPEVMEHLLTAAREFLLAAKAVMDARAADLEDDDGKGTRLERIEIA